MVAKLKAFYSYIFEQKNLPSWIVFLNYGSLVGIFAWPIFAFSGLFMFDDPETKATGWDYLLLIGYPLVLVLITFTSFKLFRVNKLISAVLPSLPIVFYLFVAIKILTGGGMDQVLRSH